MIGGPSDGGEVSTRYPAHLQHHAERLQSLWATGEPAHIFPGGQARALLPWPGARRLPGGRRFDADLVAGEFAHAQPALALVDPRTLWASQTYVLQGGVLYYLRDRWFRTGQTWADRHKLFNRLPVVERRSDGTDVIVGGHHRSCAALLLGLPVLARIVAHPGRDGGERVDLRLPSLAVGPWAAAHAAPNAGAAAHAIASGTRVTVTDDHMARATIGVLAAGEEASWRRSP